MIILRTLVLAALLCNSPTLWGITDPTELSGLLVWTDAQDVNGNGVQPADGAVITTWADKSSNGNDLTTAAGSVTFEATGFNGMYPGLRFPLVARMARSNPFAGANHSEITLFVVNANVTLTNNFAVNLNGTQVSSSAADGRFSLHLPWVNNRIYFDAGACCGSTRLSGTNPNSLTETTLYTALSDQPGFRQWLRIDGQPFRSDSNGMNANVSRGIHLGDLPGSHKYDGRFAEFVLYDRALSLAETQEVECYLMQKWKPADAPQHCLLQRDFSDAPASYGDPSHQLDTNIRLGATITTESGGYNDANANADIDDGVNIPTLTLGASSTITVNVTGANARLNAWIDWNANGTFETPAEQIASGAQDSGNGTIELSVAVPTDSVITQTFARFRWSTDMNISATNAAVNGEVEDYAVTPIVAGTNLSGTIFLDNGVGTGIAHNAQIDGSESGGQYATVSIKEASTGIEIALATADIAGNWSVTIPGTFEEIEIVASPVNGFLSVSEFTNSLSVSANQSQIDGTYSATLVPGTTVTDLNFGLIAQPTLTKNQTSTIKPGQIIDLPHFYIAGSTAEVTFALVDQTTAPLDSFTAALFVDSDCDGHANSLLIGSLSVTAGQRICLIARSHAKSNLGSFSTDTYASHSFTITAQSDFTNSILQSHLRNDDTIELNNAQLTLTKTVRNVTGSGLADTSNSGKVGDILEYRILMQNFGDSPLFDVTVNDSTPMYTFLASPIPSPISVTAGISCTVVTPSHNVAGYSGPIQWSCPGTFLSGAKGSITFQVKIRP